MSNECIKYEVQVCECRGDVVVKRILCDSMDKAEKVDDGININLNHVKYYTMIETCREND